MKFFSLVVILASAMAIPRFEEFRGPAVDKSSISDARESTPSNLDPRRNVGSMSCTAVACHGNSAVASRTGTNGGIRIKQNEFSTWLARDPHTKALAVLSNAQSQQIFNNLGVPKNDQHKSNPLFVRIRENCMGCHAVRYAPPHQEQPQAIQTPVVSESYDETVSCEACHGGAEHWRAEHHMSSFKNMSSASRLTIGYADMRDLWVRAKKCAECHIGSRGRNVDHDLIAAGHPQMFFEFSAYFRQLPKHWISHSVSGKAGTANSRPLELWFVGQLMSAATDLQQLHDRSADDRAIWPEFSNHSCFSCHQDLQWGAHKKTEAASDQGATRPKAITTRLNDWHLTLLQNYAGRVDNSSARALDSHIDELRSAMQAKLIPTRDHVASASLAAVKAIDSWTRELGRTQGRVDVSELTDVVLQLAARPRLNLTWSEAVQILSGLTAVTASLEKTTKLENVEQNLARLRTRLSYKLGVSSPRDFNSNRDSTIELIKSIATDLSDLTTNERAR